MKPASALALGVARSACATSAPAPTPASGPGRAGRLDPGLAVATFDGAWSAVKRTFWDTTSYGVNWRPRRYGSNESNQATKATGVRPRPA